MYCSVFAIRRAWHGAKSAIARRLPPKSPEALPAIALTLCFAAWAGGCGSAPLRMPPISEAASHTYLVHLPGMAGLTDWDRDLVRGLGEAGVAGHLEIYDWTGEHWMIGAVRAYDHNRAEAKRIAEAIALKTHEDPDDPIILTGWSAGCAVAIWALEDLPDDVRIDAVLLVQPAVDANHDLSRALRHVRSRCFATQSGNDTFFLGIGTLLFGTTDGGASNAGAGNTGFAMPSGCDPAQYKKLVTIPYQSAWLHYGNFGGHLGPMDRGFAKEVLGPILIKP